MALYFVRHGETDWNVEGRLQGQKDISLNGRGRDQAKAVGRTLRRLIGDGSAAAFHASPLSRTRETMERMRRAMGLDPDAYRTDPRLMELTFGDWEGMTWPEVKLRSPRAAQEREQDKWSFVPPGGESYAMLAERVNPLFGELPEPAVVVSHGGVARVLLAVRAGVDTAIAARMNIFQGRILVFEDNAYRWI